MAGRSAGVRSTRSCEMFSRTAQLSSLAERGTSQMIARFRSVGTVRQIAMSFAVCAAQDDALPVSRLLSSSFVR